MLLSLSVIITSVNKLLAQMLLLNGQERKYHWYAGSLYYFEFLQYPEVYKDCGPLQKLKEAYNLSINVWGERNNDQEVNNYFT
jgi:hypothetical protein